MKTYQYTTYDVKGNEVNTYVTDCVNAKQAREEAKDRVANSRDNEFRHGRITLRRAASGRYQPSCEIRRMI